MEHPPGLAGAAWILGGEELHHIFQSVLLRGKDIQHIAHQAGEQHAGALLPEAVPLVPQGDQGGAQGIDVLFQELTPAAVIADVVQGVVPVGVQGVREIHMDDPVAAPPEMGPEGADQAALCVGDDHASAALEQVGLDIAPGLAGAAGADDQVVVVDAGGPGVVADEGILSQDPSGVRHGVKAPFFAQMVWMTRSARPKATASSASNQVSLQVLR